MAGMPRSKALSVTPALIYLVLFFAVPVLWLLGLSVIDTQSGALTTANYERLASTPLYGRLLAITLSIAGWTTLIAVVGGYPVAYLLARLRRGRDLLLLLVLMPFWTSFLVRAFAWMVLLGRNGAINQWLNAAGITDQPIQLLFNTTGVLIGMVHAMMPLAILTMLPVMLAIDRNQTHAASTLGARAGSSFWLIWFPLSMPGVAAAGMLVFITALGFFITPALLGGERDTVIVQEIIFQIQQQLNWSFAGAIGVLMIVTVLAIIAAYNALFGLASLSNPLRPAGTGHGSTVGRLVRRGGRLVLEVLARLTDGVIVLVEGAVRAIGLVRVPRAVAGIGVGWIAATLIFLIVPTLFIIPVAFTEAQFLSWPPRGFSTDWFADVLSSSVWINAAGTSILVGLMAAGLGLLLGVPAALAMARSRMRGQAVVFAFLVSPVVVPNIFLAVGLFYLFSRLGLTATSLGLILGHAVLAVPYVVITVLAVARGYDERLDFAAYTLGANKLQTLWRVTLPVLRPGLIAAFMFAFVISFDELTLALFLTGGEMTTLPKRMWDDAVLQVNPALAAVSALMLVFMTGLVVTAEMIRRRGTRGRL